MRGGGRGDTPSPGLSFPGRFLRILARPSPAIAGPRVPGLSLRLPPSAALFPPTTAGGTRNTMISTKEKNKSPKDSMTLLPCFYFVEVSGGGGRGRAGGGRAEASVPPGPHAEVQGRPCSDHARVGAQLEGLGVGLCWGCGSEELGSVG